MIYKNLLRCIYSKSCQKTSVSFRNFLNYRWEDVDLPFTRGLYYLFNRKFFNNSLPAEPVIKFTNSKKLAGSCYYYKHKIHLSNIVIPLADSPYLFFLETLLHEMVHLLEYCHYGQKPGHGKIFQAHARNISMQTGLNIQSQHYVDVSANARYIGICPNCGYKTYRIRKPRNLDVACSKCCKKYNKGRYTNRFRFSWGTL